MFKGSVEVAESLAVGRARVFSHVCCVCGAQGHWRVAVTRWQPSASGRMRWRCWNRPSRVHVCQALLARGPSSRAMLRYATDMLIDALSMKIVTSVPPED
jgi:hypothetical protein